MARVNEGSVLAATRTLIDKWDRAMRHRASTSTC